MSWEIELRGELRFRVELSDLDWADAGRLSEARLGRVLVACGNQRFEFGELFRAKRIADDQAVINFQGDLAMVDGVGAGMSSGAIAVHGSVGNRVGAAMRGGVLTIHGDAGDDLGMGMSKGLIQVSGDSGRRVGSGIAGKETGMQGGKIVVLGNCDVGLGERMRRGMIAVGGAGGDFVGRAMQGGTIIATRLGEWIGQAMHRGMILCQSCDQPNSAFSAGGVVEPTITRLIHRSLSRIDNRHLGLFEFLLSRKWRHWHGDNLNGARGELLVSGESGPTR